MLSYASNSTASPQACAKALLDALPPVIGVVRREMRRHRVKAMSVPQFRTLALLRSAPEANLSAVADFLGASLPTASRIVSGLVSKGYICRRECPCDRRKVELVLTARGVAAMKVARQSTEAKLSERLESLDEGDRGAVLQAMELLHALFSPELREDCE